MYRILSVACLLSVSSSASISSSAWSANLESPLRYASTKDAVFTYLYELEVDGLERREVTKGEMSYEVIRSNSEQLSLLFKSRASNGQSYSKIRFSVTPMGEVQSIGRESQLPGLLGNLATLPFAVLAEEAKDTWEEKQKISIHRTSTDNRRSFAPFNSRLRSQMFIRSPLFQQGGETETTSAEEIRKHTVESVSDGLVTVSTDYVLESALDVDGRKVVAKGKGTWQFNLNDQMPESVDLERTVSTIQDKVTVRTPVKIWIKRLSPEEKEERVALAKKRAEESKKHAAAQKIERSKPLSEKEKTELVAILNSGKLHDIHGALIRLSQRTPPKPDAEIVAAIRTARAVNERFLDNIADRAILAWSPPEERARLKLNAEYRDRRPVDSTDLRVDAAEDLFIGQIIQFRRNARSGFWKPGKVQEILENGEVRVVENPPFNEVHVVPCSQIQLAPPEVDQPEAPDTDKLVEDYRTWTDKTGTHQTVAKLLEFDGEVAKLRRRRDKKVLKLSPAKLSKDDQEYLKRTLEKKEQIPNPFE